MTKVGAIGLVVLLATLALVGPGCARHSHDRRRTSDDLRGVAPATQRPEPRHFYGHPLRSSDQSDGHADIYGNCE